MAVQQMLCGIGLWDKLSDKNQPFTFVSEEAFLKANNPLPLVPYPANLTRSDGSLSLSKLQGIVATGDAPLRYAREFADQAKRTLDIHLAVNPVSAGCHITMAVDGRLAHEAYRLSINESGVMICSADSTGFFYGLQTLKQLLPSAIYGQKLEKNETWTLPYVEIEDEPKFGYRGFMLDVSSHFFSKKGIMRVLDVMASYKLNRFHWRLTGDQGWRIQIPEYPLLTEVGSVRRASISNKGDYFTFFDDTEYGRGMWYSLDDLREVVAYAKARNIEILPEVAMPNRMTAALAAYPELGCYPTKKYCVRFDDPVSFDVPNISQNNVMDFFKCVLDHMAEVFPYKYIHLGGDECFSEQWYEMDDCLRLVKKLKLSSVDQLQRWLLDELGLYVGAKYDKDIILLGNILPQWRSTDMTEPIFMTCDSLIQTSIAAFKGFNSIVSLYNPLSFDEMQMPFHQRYVDEKYQGGRETYNFNSVETVYALDPVARLRNREFFCTGVQANMLTETCNDSTELEYQLFPRMLALSETAWLPAKKKNFTSFSMRLFSHNRVLDALGVTYAPHYFNKKALTAAETAVKEAEDILAAAADNYVGLPVDTKKRTLTKNLDGLKANMEDVDGLTALNSAIRSYKKAKISMPEEGKYYLILSASTDYQAKYVGSSLYAADNNVRFHYTKQYQPEEVWQFVPVEGGYKVRNAFTGKEMTMPAEEKQNVLLTRQGSVMKLALATQPGGQYTYIPAVLNISSEDKYLSAYCSGFARSGNEPGLCYPGTWRVVEVTDFAFMLQHLVDRCERILRDGRLEGEAELTEEASRLLNDGLVGPAKALLANGAVGRADYDCYLALYQQFMAMAHVAVVDGIDERYFYRLRNAYFPEFYLQATTDKGVIPSSQPEETAYFHWRFRKNDDGTVSIYNRMNNEPAYPSSDNDAARIHLGKEYAWTLDRFTCNEGQNGIRIRSASGAVGWYIQPYLWPDRLVLKDITYRSAIWIFEKLIIPTGIDRITTDNAKESKAYYDLQGRRMKQPLQHGVYIRGNGEKVIR